MHEIRTLAALMSLAILFGCAACDQNSVKEGPREQTPIPAPSPGATPRTAPAAETPDLSGKVVETMDAGTYTYVLVESSGKKAWWAAPKTKVSVGEEVSFPGAGIPMVNFESPTLKRTFDVIYFAGAMRTEGGADAEAVIKDAHAAADKMAESRPVAPVENVAKAEGGVTVEAIFKESESLIGKEITLRGRVVKYNAAIMGKNWLHVRDGTGKDGSNDITVTSSDSAKVGDTVLIKGKLVANKDFGYGYKFDLIVEDAKVTVE